jgi:2,4-dienoyl-CoA reductase-like NADH-dependent reductase (Old Yellow Enzyme family)
MTDPASPLPLPRGPALPNRFMLAPLTNQQSNADGTLSDAEFHWLTMRAQGGFALTMTCAAHVQKGGQAFDGQLGIWSDAHLPGLTRLAAAIRAAGSVSAVQLHHGGLRTEPALTGEPRLAPFDDAETGATALSTAQVHVLRDAFITAAVRAQSAGFDGVELHGAHGYMLCSFLDADRNQRIDGYGGSFDNRSRIFFEIIDGIRSITRPDFQLGVRISPERFGIPLAEARELALRLLATRQLDYLDLSLWDVFKAPVEEVYAGTELIDHFTDLPRHGAALGVAGKITTAATARKCLARGADFVLIGRGAVLHHDFPRLALADPDFTARPLPVPPSTLAAEGLSPTFITYMRNWKGFVADAG